MDPRIEKALGGRTPKAAIVILDRSRVEARQKCPELRNLHYSIPVLTMEGKEVFGVMRKAAAVPLVTGITMHHGLALIMQGANEDEAVKEAIEGYNETLRTRGLYPQGGTPMGWLAEEQRALSEGLIRVANRRAAQKILKNFDVLAVEEEILVYLGEVDDEWGGVTFLWAGRLDALIRDGNGIISVLNWKTQKKWYSSDAQRIRLDMQTVGEAWAASQAYGLAVSGVQYIYLIKGEQREDPEKKFKVTYNHLTRAWRTIGPSGGMQYAWAYYHEGTKRQVMSKGLGFATFEEYPGGIKAWVDALDEGLILPQGEADPLDSILRIPPAVGAGQARVERWQAQTLRDEYRWYRDLVEGRPPSRHENGFNCGAGDWKCQMHDVCHEGESVTNRDKYLPRDPNHPVESVTWEE